MRHHSKASLFLIELIIAILFFSIASALCIQIFVKAKQIDEESLMQSHATIAASSIIETDRSHQLEEFYTIDDQGMIYFDSYWYPTTSTYTYKAKLVKQQNSLTITMYKQDRVIFTIESKQYQQRTF